MAAAARTLLLVTVLGTALLGTNRPVRSQAFVPAPDAVLPPPRSEDPPPPPPQPTLGPPVPLQTPASVSPAPPPGPPPNALNPLFHPRDPGPDGWGPYGLPSIPSALFANVEVDILKPHLKAALSNAVIFANGSETTVRPPTTQPGWTAAPRFEVGWYLPDSLGLFALNYRGFASSGQQDATSLDGTPFALRTRLDLNQVGFDYGSLPYSFAPHWDISGRVGVALADVFFDNRAVSARSEAVRQQ